MGQADAAINSSEVVSVIDNAVIDLDWIIIA